MQVPEGVGLGNAKLTISYPDWKEANVAAGTFTVELADRPLPIAVSSPPPRRPSGGVADANKRVHVLYFGILLFPLAFAVAIVWYMVKRS